MSYLSEHLAWQQRVSLEKTAARKFHDGMYRTMFADESKPKYVMKYASATSDPNQMSGKDFVGGKGANYFMLSAANKQDQNKLTNMSSTMFNKTSYSKSDQKKLSPVNKTRYTFGGTTNINQSKEMQQYLKGANEEELWPTNQSAKNQEMNQAFNTYDDAEKNHPVLKELRRDYIGRSKIRSKSSVKSEKYHIRQGHSEAAKNKDMEKQCMKTQSIQSWKRFNEDISPNNMKLKERPRSGASSRVKELSHYEGSQRGSQEKRRFSKPVSPISRAQSIKSNMIKSQIMRALEYLDEDQLEKVKDKLCTAARKKIIADEKSELNQENLSKLHSMAHSQRDVDEELQDIKSQSHTMTIRSKHTQGQGSVRSSYTYITQLEKQLQDEKKARKDLETQLAEFKRITDEIGKMADEKK